MIAKLLVISLFFSLNSFANDVSSDNKDVPASELFGLMNRGWPSQYRPVLKKLDPSRSYMWLRITPPDDGIDMRSAELLRESTVARVPFWMGHMGHALLLWQCQQGKGQKPLVGLGSMTSDAGSYLPQMMLHGWGITPVLSQFNDGRIELHDLSVEVDSATIDPKPTSNLIFEVSQESCQQALNFAKSFIAHEERPHRIYSLTAKPTNYEGGSCLSFSWAMLEKAQVFPSPIFPLAWRKLDVPLAVLGRGAQNSDGVSDFSMLNPPPEFIGYKFKSTAPEAAEENLPGLRIIDWMRRQAWAPWGETAHLDRIKFLGGPTEPVDMVDPEVMIYLISTVEKNFVRTQAVDEEQTARYLKNYPEFRWTSRWAPYPSPKYDGVQNAKAIFASDRIDENFDPQMKGVKSIMDAWWNEKVAQGSKARLIPLGISSSILVIENR